MMDPTLQDSGSVDALVVGAGHAGLAMSYYLSRQGIRHVVLERGEVANSWRRERWDSLRLLTPNWQSRLPGYAYSGAAPDDFMSVAEVIDFIARYARRIDAPVCCHTRVISVSAEAIGYRVVTNRGEWFTRALVIASGACNRASIPAIASKLPASIRQISARDYRNPGQLDQGKVLVVGASATGLQLAEEIHRSGRDVTLAVGEHVRLPRSYRGRDIQYWMQAIGLLDESVEQADDLERLRKLPSPQLIGSSEGRSLDLNRLSALGVRLTGRLAGVSDGKAQFSGSLRNVCTLADLKMNRLLDSIDAWIEQQGEQAPQASRPEPTRIADNPALSLDFAGEGIRSLVWATGYRPDYSWLQLPVLDRKGRLRHQGGVVDAPGVYALGLPFMRRRNSSFIHGIDADARDLSDHLAEFLDDSWHSSQLQLAS